MRVTKLANFVSGGWEIKHINLYNLHDGIYFSLKPQYTLATAPFCLRRKLSRKESREFTLSFTAHSIKTTKHCPWEEKNAIALEARVNETEVPKTFQKILQWIFNHWPCSTWTLVVTVRTCVIRLNIRKTIGTQTLTTLRLTSQPMHVIRKTRTLFSDYLSGSFSLTRSFTFFLSPSSGKVADYLFGFLHNDKLRVLFNYNQVLSEKIVSFLVNLREFFLKEVNLNATKWS